jgi:uncharacterized repeat protein (TIGR01451 family)
MKRAPSLFVLWLAFSLPAMATDLFTVFSTLKSSDPVQQGRLSRSGIVSDWSASKAFPGTVNASTSYHYEVFPVNVGSSTFVQITIDDPNGPNGFFFASAYVDSYNPASEATNYLGDAGFSGNGIIADPAYFQVVVPANHTLIVVVNDTIANNGGVGSSFTIRVQGFADTQYTSVSGAPALRIAKTHSGAFTPGQQGTYTITVSNAPGAGPTSGPVTVTEMPPAGLTLISMSGTGWNCPPGGAACTESDALAPGANYPAILVTVMVAPTATTPLVNSAMVSGGGSPPATAFDSTTFVQPAPVLSVTKTHAGNFTLGQQGAVYSVTVSNHAGMPPTSGAVSVSEALPSALSLVSMVGVGWSCGLGVCTRSDVLAGGASYPPIAVTVNVANSGASPQVNKVIVLGGGSAGATASDSTVLVAAPFLGNDEAASAAVVSSLPASITEGTGTATANPTDPVHSCTGVKDSKTVWFRFVPNFTGPAVVDTLTSSYLTVLSAYQGLVDASTEIACNAGPSGQSEITMQVTSGQVYYVEASAVGGSGVGGTLILHFSTAPVPRLSIAKTHSGNFARATPNATYTVTVSNAGGAPTTGDAVTVSETVPSGLTVVSMAGTGWDCLTPGLQCARREVLAPGSSYPPITVTVKVAANATSPQVNTVSVVGGGSVLARVSDPTIIIPDTIPPATSASPEPPANFNGWNNSNIAVALTAVDNPGGSGVMQIQYSLAGAQTFGPQVVPGNTATVNITAEGITTLTYFATDFAGNVEQAKTLTIRIDKTPPVISGMPPAGCSLWPPNHKLVQVAVVTASDALSGLAPGSFTVTGTSNEPIDPSDPSIVITPNGSGGFAVQLQADRLGSGNGRLYTLTATATDIAGNAAKATATCAVPHDQGQ